MYEILSGGKKKESRDRDLKGDLSFSKGSTASRRAAAHTMLWTLKLGVVTRAFKHSAQIANPARASHQNSVLRVGGGVWLGGRVLA